MRLERHRRLVVRMGEYESYEFTATVSLSHHDLGVSDEQLFSLDAEHRDRLFLDLQTQVAAELDAAIEQDMDDAADLSDRKSFIRRARASAPAPTTAPATAKTLRRKS